MTMFAPLNEHTIRRRFPHPIAAAWRRVSLAETNEERVRRLVACNEILLRMLAAMLLPDYLRGLPVHAVETAIQKLDRPPEGVWLEIVRELIRAIGTRPTPEPFIPEAYPWFFTRSGELNESASFLDEFNRVRNAFVHPNSINSKLTGDHARDLHHALRSALITIDWLPGYRPFRVTSIDTTPGGSFNGKVQFLVGTEEQTDLIPATWTPHLVKRYVYLSNPHGTSLLDLVPFVEFAPDPNDGQDRLFLMKKVKDLRWVIRVHDATGSSIKKEVESADGDVAFKRWLENRASLKPVLENKTSSGTFRMPGQGQNADSNLDLGPRFEKREELGRGGMATVFRVFESQTGKEFALKVLSSDLADDPTCCKRFSREAQNMTRARHVRIVQMLEIGELPGGQPFLKMPIVAKGSLDEQITPDAGRPAHLVRRWAQDALEALACVHRHDIVHRDVKPSNFLIDDDNHAMLTDFGIARGAADEKLTQTLDQLGTPAYMAPEQRQKDNVTAKADIYSLAIVLHELLTGSRPAVPGKGISGPFGELIARMGAAEPEQRPTAAEALAQLKQLKRRTKAHPTPTPLPITPVPEPLLPPEPTPPPLPEPLPLPEPVPIAAPKPRAPLVDWKVGLRPRLIAVAIFVALFAVNWIETAAETWLRNEHQVGIATERQMADAALWFERGLSFEHHDSAGNVAKWGFSIVYFAVFPLLILGTMTAFAYRRDPRPLTVMSVAIAVDYVLTLPFYLFFPVPERWSYPDANAILLSDLVSTSWIEYIRPFSGVNNCFPSFHVSVTVVALLCLFRARARFRLTALPLAVAIILSTFALGIHWISDIAAGLGAGAVSVAAAERLLRWQPLVRLLQAPPRRVLLHQGG